MEWARVIWQVAIAIGRKSLKTKFEVVMTSTNTHNEPVSTAIPTAGNGSNIRSPPLI